MKLLIIIIALNITETIIPKSEKLEPQIRIIPERTEQQVNKNIYHMCKQINLWFNRVFCKKKFDPIDKNYSLIFSEDFTMGVDWNHWSWREPWSGNEDSHKENTWWRKECVQKTEEGINLVANIESETTNKCGLISSHKFMNILYGYVEVDAKMPSNGFLYFPAIWMYDKNGWLPEIDIVELMGNTSKHCSFTHHWLDDAFINCSEGKSFKLPFDLSQEFHSYGMEWTPNYITWFIDRIPYYTITNNIPNVPLFLICNIQAGGKPAFTHVYTSNEVPAYMQVKKIKVFQK